MDTENTGSDTLEHEDIIEGSEEDIVDDVDDTDELDPNSETVPRNHYENQKKRAEKRDAENRELKEKLLKLEGTSEKDNTSDSGTVPTAEISVVDLFKSANKLDDEEYAHLEKVARLEGVQVTQAIDNELFVGWRQKREKQKRSEEAALGASRGSGSQRRQKTFQSKDLTPEEHRAMTNKRIRSEMRRG